MGAIVSSMRVGYSRISDVTENSPPQCQRRASNSTLAFTQGVAMDALCKAHHPTEERRQGRSQRLSVDVGSGAYFVVVL